MRAGESKAQPGGSEPRPGRNPLTGTRRTDEPERRSLHRLQVMMQLLLATIAQDKTMTVDEAALLVAKTRDSALRLFPGRETAYDLLCRPRIQRAMRERFHIQ